MLDKKMLIVGLLMLIPGIATFTCYKMYGRDIENGVEGPIKAAAASEDVGVALKGLGASSSMPRRKDSAAARCGSGTSSSRKSRQGSMPHP